MIFMETIIEIPKGMQVEIQGYKIVVKKGNAENIMIYKSKTVEATKNEDKILLKADNSTRNKATINSIEKHIMNLFKGLDKAYVYKLAIVYSHFPISLNVKGQTAEVANFLGEKKPRLARIIGKAKVEVKGKEVTVTGINKDDVGQTSANIENVARQTKKDTRVFQDGIYIVSKD